MSRAAALVLGKHKKASPQLQNRQRDGTRDPAPSLQKARLGMILPGQAALPSPRWCRDCSPAERSARRETVLPGRGKVGLFLDIFVTALLQWLTFADPRGTQPCSAPSWDKARVLQLWGKGTWWERQSQHCFILWMVLLCCTNSREGPPSSG